MLIESGHALARLCYVAYKECCLHPFHRHLNTPLLWLFTPLHRYLITPQLCAPLSSAPGHASAKSSASAKLLLRKVVSPLHVSPTFSPEHASDLGICLSQELVAENPKATKWYSTGPVC